MGDSTFTLYALHLLAGMAVALAVLNVLLICIATALVLRLRYLVRSNSRPVAPALTG